MKDVLLLCLFEVGRVSKEFEMIVVALDGTEVAGERSVGNIEFFAGLLYNRRDLRQVDMCYVRKHVMFDLVIESSRHPSPKLRTNTEVCRCQALQLGPVTTDSGLAWKSRFHCQMIHSKHEHEHQAGRGTEQEPQDDCVLKRVEIERSHEGVPGVHQLGASENQNIGGLQLEEVYVDVLPSHHRFHVVDVPLGRHKATDEPEVDVLISMVPTKRQS